MDASSKTIDPSCVDIGWNLFDANSALDDFEFFNEPITLEDTTDPKTIDIVNLCGALKTGIYNFDLYANDNSVKDPDPDVQIQTETKIVSINVQTGTVPDECNPKASSITIDS